MLAVPDVAHISFPGAGDATLIPQKVYPRTMASINQSVTDTECIVERIWEACSAIAERYYTRAHSLQMVGQVIKWDVTGSFTSKEEEENRKHARRRNGLTDRAASSRGGAGAVV